MTDTDKLKRLADALIADDDCPMLVPPQTILALIAENKALSDYGRDAAREAVQCRRERDEAVALLRETEGLDFEMTDLDIRIDAFLARIDAQESE